MLDRNTSEKSRLIQARNIFERTLEHFHDAREYMEEDVLFYHNVDGESQWDNEDLQYLKEQNRPALTFNLIFNKVNQAIGLHEDHRHRPRVAPASGSQKDIALSRVLTALLETARRCADMDAVDSMVYEHSIVMGEGNAQISVELDPDTPGWILFKGLPQSGLQVLWDIASESPERLDARYVFWDKWVSFDQFKVDYPEHAKKARAMLDDQWNGSIDIDDGGGGFDATVDDEDDYQAEFGESGRTRYYVNRQYRKVRIIHLEYETLVKRHFLVGGAGQRKEVDQEFAAMAKKARDAGDPQFVGTSIYSTHDSEKFWFEFIGNDILYDDESPEPHSGFTLSPMVCFLDSHQGFAYGMVRNMKDPQRDVNKAHSQSLDHLTNQAKPGWIAEQSAIPNPEQFEEANRQSGSTSFVRDGAISGGQIQPRQIPQFSEAGNTRLQTAVNLLNLVSGISSEPEDPARGVEAATTVAIRERKSLRALTRVLRHFERYQVRVATLILEAIVTTMPDDQIAAWLGDNGEFEIQGGNIHLKSMDERKPSQPVASIRDMRNLKYSVELEPSSKSDVSRLMMLNIIMQLAATQVNAPVDPELIYELMSTDRATRERLSAFAREAAQQQAKSSQEQLQVIKTQAEADAMEAQAKVGKAMADTELKRSEIDNDLRVAILDLWLKADSEEKKFITDLINIKATVEQAKQSDTSPTQEE
jgi:hypothetical protein